MKNNIQEALTLLRRMNLGACAHTLLNYAEALVGRGAPRSLPSNVDVILTRICNLSSVFCISYGSLRDADFMPFPLYEQVALRLFPTAHSVFFCSGGEPLLYPQIRQALQLALG